MADLINPLVAQYLSGLGADLMKYGGDTSKGLQLENVNAITKQSADANAQSKLLKHFLSPDNKDNMKIGPGGITMTLGSPSEAPPTKLGSLGQPIEAEATPVKTTQSTMQGEMSSALAEDSKGTDIMSLLDSKELAGASPEMIRYALNMKMEQDKLKQQSIKDIQESLYKNALTEQAKATTAENTPSVDIMVGDKSMKVTPKDAIAWTKIQKESKPVSQKEFEAAENNSDYAAFLSKVKPGEKELFLRATMADPKLRAAALEMAKAGATQLSLGDLVKRKQALDKVDAQTMVMKPDFMSKIEKGMGQPSVWTFDNQEAVKNIKLRYPNMSDEQASATAFKAAKLGAAESQIKAAFTDAIRGKDGWYRTLPNGKQVLIRRFD